jgi:hypothetical protein
MFSVFYREDELSSSPLHLVRSNIRRNIETLQTRKKRRRARDDIGYSIIRNFHLGYFPFLNHDKYTDTYTRARKHNVHLDMAFKEICLEADSGEFSSVDASNGDKTSALAPR